MSDDVLCLNCQKSCARLEGSTCLGEHAGVGLGLGATGTDRGGASRQVEASAGLQRKETTVDE